MTNITLSIDNEVYERMQEYSEIKWSTFVRKAITQRLNELDRIDEHKKETLLCMLATQEVLAEDWESEHDQHWNEL